MQMWETIKLEAIITHPALIQIQSLLLSSNLVLLLLCSLGLKLLGETLRWMFPKYSTESVAKQKANQNKSTINKYESIAEAEEHKRAFAILKIPKLSFYVISPSNLIPNENINKIQPLKGYFQKKIEWKVVREENSCIIHKMIIFSRFSIFFLGNFNFKNSTLTNL